MERAAGPYRRVLAGIGLLTLAVLAGCTRAWAEPGAHGLVRLASDYVYRGYTKGDGNPVVQLNVDYLSAPGWYAGAWVSQVDFGEADTEVIGYAGLRHALGDAIRLDVSASRYWYDTRVFDRRAGYEEYYAALHYADRATLGIGFAPAPYGLEDPVTNAQLELRHSLSDAIEASAGAGYEWAGAAYHYDIAHWNAGLTWFAGRVFALDLRYHGARELDRQPHAEAPGGDIADAAIDQRVVLSVSAGL